MRPTALLIANSNESHKLALFPGRQNDPNPFIQWKSGDPLRFATDASTFTELMRIDASGNLGIATLAPTEKLEVIGNVKFSGALMPNNTAGTAGQVLTSAGADVAPTWATVPVSISPANTVIRGNAAGTAQVASQIFDNGTNVGIGTATPSYSLDVNGEVASRSGNGFRLRQSNYSTFFRNDNSTFYLMLTNSGNPDGSWNSFRPFSVDLASGRTSLHNFASLANGTTVIDGGGGNSGTIANSLVFGDLTSGEGIASKRNSGGNQLGLDFYTGYVNRMSLTSGGNVGIGTTIPSSQFHVVGASGTGPPRTGSGSLYIQDNGGAPLNGGSVLFGAIQGYWAGIKGLINFGGGNTTGDLAFYTRNTSGDATLSERLRITNSGNVGIGTTTPTEKLHINGNVNVNGAITSSALGTAVNGSAVVGYGVRGVAGIGAGIYGELTNPANGNAGEFNGNVLIRDGFAIKNSSGGGTPNLNDGDNNIWFNWTGSGFEVWVDASRIVTFNNTGTTKNFIIDHPDYPKEKYLVHTTLEGPENGVYYRGKGKLINGEASIQLPAYFNSLTKDGSATVILTAVGKEPYLLSYDEFDEKSFKVYGTEPTGEFSWEVKAERQDVNDLLVEPNKSDITVYGNGPYKYYSQKVKPTQVAKSHTP